MEKDKERRILRLMFLSTKSIISGLAKYPEITHIEAESSRQLLTRIAQWFINLDNSQIDKPTIVVNIEEKGVVLYCNDALWDIVQKWQSKQLDNMTLLDGIKIWKEIKSIMEKDKK